MRLELFSALVMYVYFDLSIGIIFMLLIVSLNTAFNNLLM